MLFGCRVLVVDDDMARGVALCQAAEDEGAVACGPFSDVLSAVRFMRSHRIDAAVLGYDVHDGDTTSLAHALQAAGKTVLFRTDSDIPALLFEETGGVAVVPTTTAAAALVVQLAEAIRNGD
jgi:DNA-binding response OmpR family regulator